MNRVNILEKMWTDDISIAWWKMLLIGVFMVMMNFGIFFAMWYVRREVAIEVGYPKRNRKSMKKRLSKYSVWEELWLFRLTHEAERKSVMLYINLICNLLNIASFAACCVGFVGCMITCADGWAFTLLVVPVLWTMGGTIAIEFIPHLLWLPSERKRYGLK